MPLTGKSKTKYMREYMRARRAGKPTRSPKRGPSDVSPTSKGNLGGFCVCCAASRCVLRTASASISYSSASVFGGSRALTTVWSLRPLPEQPSETTARNISVPTHS